MRCLVVTAHPVTESLCAATARRVIELLRSAGHQVVVEDLYATGFQPALTLAERTSYYQPVYARQGVTEEIERLLSCEAMVLIFPTWWFGFPAVLKGWFDRVWGPGVAYDHAGTGAPIRPRLDNLREVLAITSLGSPWWVDWLVMRRPVPGVLKKAIVRACAPGCRLRIVSVYASEQLPPSRVERHWRRIERALSRWQPGDD